MYSRHCQCSCIPLLLSSTSAVCFHSQYPAPASLCWRAARTHFAYIEPMVPGSLRLPPRRPTLNQELTLQGYKYYSSLTSDVDSWGSTCTVPRAPLWDWAKLSPSLPPSPWALLDITPLSVYSPLTFVLVLFLHLPTVFFLSHTTIHFKGTKRITRCVLQRMISYRCCWPGNHNDIGVCLCVHEPGCFSCGMNGLSRLQICSE